MKLAAALILTLVSFVAPADTIELYSGSIREAGPNRTPASIHDIHMNQGSIDQLQTDNNSNIPDWYRPPTSPGNATLSGQRRFEVQIPAMDGSSKDPTY